MAWEWNRERVLGKGSSATVYLATSSNPSDPIFAVKSSPHSHSKRLKREQQILSSLSSPNIVGYKGHDITYENNEFVFNLFMEYMRHGTLSEFTRQHGGRLEEQLVALIAREVVEALEFMHSKDVVHCNIKGSNILIGEGGVFKVGDFGCSKSVTDEEALITGTPMYMAPEVARGDEQGFASDIWSLGCTVLEIATGKSPWPKMENPGSLVYHIGSSDEVPEIPYFLSDVAKDFLEKCFRRNPNLRWTATQLLTHPFLGGFPPEVNLVPVSSLLTPTSIIEEQLSDSVEYLQNIECSNVNLVQTSFENSPDRRIRQLAECSGGPK